VQNFSFVMLKHRTPMPLLKYKRKFGESQDKDVQSFLAHETRKKHERELVG
jgi:hypothetical protein